MQIYEGQKLHYFPRKEAVDDNRHWPVEVVKIGKRIQVRGFMEGAPPEGILRSVSPERLADQPELF